VIRLWRRFMAWLNEPDEVTVYVATGSSAVWGEPLWADPGKRLRQLAELDYASMEPHQREHALRNLEELMETLAGPVAEPHCATCAKGVHKG
jgi:hypothetical protein